MNNKLLIIVAAVVLVVGGGAAAFMLTQSDKSTQNNNSSPQDTNSASNNQPKDQQASAQTGSIEQFLSSGESKECTYADAETKGTMYFASGERLRLDYQGTKDTDTSGSMIITNSKQYVWSSDNKEGFTFAFDKDAVDSSDQNTSTVDTSKEYSFTCKDWSVDEAKFTPPANVTFRDMSQLMQTPTQP